MKSTDIQKAYIGSTEVEKIYIGSDLIYQNAIDYSKIPLTLISLDDNNVIGWKSNKSTNLKTISVSTDNGATWTSYTASTASAGTTLATLNTGDKLLVKGNNNLYASSSFYHWFRCTGRFNPVGNMMSLIYGDNFIDKVDFPSGSTYNFAAMFDSCKVITAENLILPATTLTAFCYTNLFQFCTQLTTSPVLGALTLANYSYQLMFTGCKLLNKITCLATDISASNCVTNMTKNVASSGTFVKNPNMSSWSTGVNGIPRNWTVVDA